MIRSIQNKGIFIIPFLYLFIACTEEIATSGVQTGKHTLHLNAGSLGTAETTGRSVATDNASNVVAYSEGVVATYNIGTEEKTTYRVGAHGKRIPINSSPQSRAVQTPDAYGTIADELNYNRIEIFYFKENDKRCFYKQAFTYSSIQSFGSSGLDIQVPQPVTDMPFSDSSYGRLQVIVIANYNTLTDSRFDVADNAVVNESVAGSLYKKLITLPVKDMADMGTLFYPGNANQTATSDRPMVMAGMSTITDLRDGSVTQVSLVRMAARVHLNITAGSLVDLEQVRILNIPDSVPLFGTDVSYAPPRQYIPEELIHTPWIERNTGTGILPNTLNNGIPYVYINENLQEALRNNTRTAVLICAKRKDNGNYTYYKTFLCPEDGTAANGRDGHIRRNRIYSLSATLNGYGGDTDETARIP